MEIWRDIKNFNGNYKVSNLGNIKSLKNNKVLIPAIVAYRKNKNNGYYVVNLKGRLYYIHRLVAETFIDNPNNLPQVNHIDGNKLNNKVENLEWCTGSENIKHAYKTKLMKYHAPTKRKYTKVQQIDKETKKIIKVWNSIIEASRILKIEKVCISACCRNKQKTAGGYIWKYIK